MTLSEDPDAPVVAPGFEQECERQRAAWRMLWDRVPLSLPGDPMLAQACRFNAFHLLQAVSPLSVGRDVGLPAWRSPKGRPGHEPWDETLALPFYSLHLPALARELLHHRVRHLEADMPRAARAAVALAAWGHHLVTGDAALLAGLTAPLLIDCARYWAARDAASAGLPAAWTLGCAADLGAHLEPAAWARVCEDANVTPAELVAWRVHAAAVPVPWLPGDVLAVASGDGVDTLVLLHLLGPEAAHALLVRMGELPPAGWYARTVRHHAADGAAPAGVARLASAGALAAVDPDASFAHFHAAALGPLREPPGLDEGLSFATMGGVWDVLVRHYLGVQPEADGLHLRPRPPEGLGDVAVRVTVGRHRLAVSLDDDTLTVTTDPQAPPLRLWSGGMVHEVQPGVPWSVVCRGVVEMA